MTSRVEDTGRSTPFTVVLSLLNDDQTVHYRLERIFRETKSIEELSSLYPNVVLLKGEKAYLKGELISENHSLNRRFGYIHVNRNFHLVRNPERYVGRHEENFCGGLTLFVGYKNIYYICETDGEGFDINSYIYL